MKFLNRIFLMLLFSAALASISFASIGTSTNGTKTGEATEINFTTGTGATITKSNRTVTIPVLDSTLLAAGTANGGATSMTSTELAVPTGYSYVRKAIANDSAFIAGTLADGKPGQILTIYITTLSGGTKTWTLTPTTKTGFTSIAFDAVGDTATFMFVNTTTGWIILSQTACTISVAGI